MTNNRAIEMHSLKHFIRESLKKSYNSLLKDEFKDLGLFITVPEVIIREIEAVFPDIKKVHSEDESPNHITLLVINKDYNKLDEIKETITKALQTLEPFTCKIHGTGAFIHEEDDSDRKSVLYAKIVSETLVQIHYKIRKALENIGVEINHYYGDENKYTPHMTLSYYDTAEELEDAPEIKIDASWLVDRVELWGYGSPSLFRFGETV